MAKQISIPGIETELEAKIATGTFDVILAASLTEDGIAIIIGREVTNALLAVVATIASKTADDEKDTGLNKWCDARRADLFDLVKQARTLPTDFEKAAPDGGLLQ